MARANLFILAMRYPHMKCCYMKGFLSYLVLWNLRKKSMTGADLANEMEKRKGSKPSPGTIYPILKELKDSGMITSEGGKKYSLTKKGQNELKTACGTFFTIFYDVHDMAVFSRHKA